MEKIKTPSCTDFFLKSLESLKPESLLDGKLVLDEENQILQIGKDKKNVDIKNGCYVVGFGKAVLGLGAFVAKKLGKHINCGVLSIPWGTSEIGDYQSLIDVCEAANVKIIEGAKDNLPDENSQKAAMAVVDLVSNLSKEDVVIVLISGGGSALLSLPVEGVSLGEKLQVVRVLSHTGASITELNTVRKALSGIKGGKLAEMIHPAKVISLVLSDIIGDPLDFIASGPTVANSDDPKAAFNIIKKYGVFREISENVIEVLSENTRTDKDQASVENLVIGNNDKPLQHIHTFAEKAGILSSILSKKICGEADEIGRTFADLALCVCSMKDNLNEVLSNLKTENAEEAKSVISTFSDINSTLAIFGGGETTVTVKGDGKGGRNQEMVLSFGIALEEARQSLQENGYGIEFLSCGTDGIDGPTDSAGAVWNMKCFDLAKEKKLDPKQFLANNDSYNFWNQIGCLVNTGHTGTNVMDIQVLLITKM
eukprot:GFUD01003352.1.p1 GENE.GFUD01003352.1~~GFUD01003352.1.p1  ORF type:complete len:482 (+),score=134.38 GFUD01003352.1:159-1604(+)